MLRILSICAALCVGAKGVHANHDAPVTNAHNVSFGPALDRVPDGLHTGTDYYPSHWPTTLWESDVSRMRDAGMSYVRMNDFDWGILEPQEGQYNFTVLDKALDLLAQYGLKAIIATPTAGPPNWASENYNIAFVDITNTTLIFGSRRHYSLSSFDYRRLSQNITQKLAERYGSNPTVAGWQIDNEIGCYGTIQSYDHDAITRFRSWLKNKYGTIENMNAAQGRVFWSTQYESFDVVQPPFLNVAPPPPNHELDWFLFSSDMTIDFAKEQAHILRRYAPEQFVTHNFMQKFSEFDHFKFAREVGVDLVSYDIYPLGGPDVFSWLSEQEQADFARVGLPDYLALNNALFRGISGAVYNSTTGPFAILEMGAGFAGWIQYRVAPLIGMVRLWGHETFASSGDLVSYFRWRQPGFAAEMAHSGLNLPDNTPDEGLGEQHTLAMEDLPKLRETLTGHEGQADVALVFDYTSVHAWDIEPWSGEWDPKSVSWTDPAVTYWDIVYMFYSALRRLGLSIDIIGVDQQLDGYKMVVVPSLPIIPDSFNTSLATYDGPVVLGPNTGSRTPEYTYASGLSPSAGTVRNRLPMKVTRVETPPPYLDNGVSYAGKAYKITAWEEWLTCTRDNQTSNVTITSTSMNRVGQPAACSKNGFHYLAFNPPIDLLIAYLGDVAAKANITDLVGQVPNRQNDLGPTLRLARRANLLWAFNYGLQPAMPPKINGEILIGQDGEIPAAGFIVWELK